MRIPGRPILFSSTKATSSREMSPFIKTSLKDLVWAIFFFNFFRSREILWESLSREESRSWASSGVKYKLKAGRMLTKVSPLRSLIIPLFAGRVTIRTRLFSESPVRYCHFKICKYQIRIHKHRKETTTRMAKTRIFFLIASLVSVP